MGLFYFLWLGEHGRGAPYDISKITAAHPDAGQHPDADWWGGVGVYHHWGEPFYGYYYSEDEWVVRRHMKLILQAGIDFLFFDTTNAVIYEKNAKLVMRVLQEYHDAGWERILFSAERQKSCQRAAAILSSGTSTDSGSPWMALTRHS